MKVFFSFISGNNASTKKQLNSINYLIAECNARIEKLAHPQSNMSALSKMTSIVSSVTALNPLSQLSTSTSFHSMGIEEEDELDSYSHLSQYNLETSKALFQYFCVRWNVIEALNVTYLFQDLLIDLFYWPILIGYSPILS